MHKNIKLLNINIKLLNIKIVFEFCNFPHAIGKCVPIFRLDAVERTTSDSTARRSKHLCYYTRVFHYSSTCLELHREWYSNPWAISFSDSYRKHIYKQPLLYTCIQFFDWLLACHMKVYIIRYIYIVINMDIYFLTIFIWCFMFFVHT